jgi:cytochrome b pre-mRNA-processing protein 3
MLGWLWKRSAAGVAAPELYARIVTAARQPELYAECGVPDTMDGRLEMILLYTVLVLERLKQEGPAGQRLGQRLMECLVDDLDDALRQIGLGDDSVAGRVQRLGAALRERAGDYAAAFAGDPPASPEGGDDRDPLARKLAEHVLRRPAAAGPNPEADRLAGIVRGERRRLAATPSAELLTGSPELGSSPGA